jgi:hypothetical protein
MPRPKSDLSALTVAKGSDEPTAPISPAASTALSLIGEPPRVYAHTLSLRLTNEEYRRLRRFVARIEEDRSVRLTHQAIITAALAAFLDKEGA